MKYNSTAMDIDYNVVMYKCTVILLNYSALLRAHNSSSGGGAISIHMMLYIFDERKSL